MKVAIRILDMVIAKSTSFSVLPFPEDATQLLFCGLSIYLAWRETYWKQLVLVGEIALLLCLLPFIFHSSNTHRIKAPFVVKQGTETPLVLYGAEW